MLEPPAGGFWNEQVIHTFWLQLLEVANSGRIVSGMVAGVGSVRSLGKMHSVALWKLKEVVIALTDHEDTSAGSQHSPCQATQMLHGLLVLDVFPGDRPRENLW